MKLHLGCGKRYLKGFTHVDLATYPHIDYKSDIGTLSFFEDESASIIYCSHALEYFDRFEVTDVLLEWNRVLIPGGSLYVSVPDLDSLIRIYHKTQDLEKILGPLFGRWPLEDGFVYHRTVWNQSTLTKKLNESGFDRVEVFNPVLFLKAIDKDYDDHSLAFYPHLDFSGIQVSLCLRAIK